MATLVERGWSVARTAGSHSPVDVVAWIGAAKSRWHDTRWALLQVKRDGRLNKHERIALREAAQSMLPLLYCVAAPRGELQVREVWTWSDTTWRPLEEVF